RGSGAEPWLELVTEMVRLPFRMFGLGVQLMVWTSQEMQRLVEGGLGERASGANPPAGRQPTPWLERVGPASAYSPASPIPGIGTGSAAGAVANLAETTNREEKDMSCDKDLSGTDLKIVDYSIVSVSANIQHDRDRIIQTTRTIATSEDMTGADFATWVIAM